MERFVLLELGFADCMLMNGYHVMPRTASAWLTGLVLTMVYEARIFLSRPTITLVAQSSNSWCGRGLDYPHDRC